LTGVPIKLIFGFSFLFLSHPLAQQAHWHPDDDYR
jgi:hypothetical protein